MTTRTLVRDATTLAGTFFLAIGTIHAEDLGCGTELAPGEAQAFLQIGNEISGVEVGISSYENARKSAKAIQSLAGEDYRVEDWMLKNRRLLSAMRLEKITAFAVLTLIVLVAVDAAPALKATSAVSVIETAFNVPLIVAVPAVVELVNVAV